MILTWVHDQEAGIISCTINEELRYTSANGGETLTKTYRGEVLELDGFDDWEDEKHWISDRFSDMFGVYSPQWDITEESWQAANPDWDGAVPLFGITPAGEYLDKLGRTSTFQEGRDMQQVYMNDEERMSIELDVEGNYWQRPWCEERSEFYNVQPCCVFPNNPGRQPMSAEAAEAFLYQDKD